MELQICVERSKYPIPAAHMLTQPVRSELIATPPSPTNILQSSCVKKCSLVKWHPHCAPKCDQTALTRPRPSCDTAPSQAEGTVAEFNLTLWVRHSSVSPGCFYPAESARDAHAGRRRGSQRLSVAGQWLSDGQVKGHNVPYFKRHLTSYQSFFFFFI